MSFTSSGTLPPLPRPIVSTQQRRAVSRAFEVRHVGFDHTRTSPPPNENKRETEGFHRCPIPSNRKEKIVKRGCICEDRLERREIDPGKAETRTCCCAQFHVDCEGGRAMRMGNAGGWRCRRGCRIYTGAMPWHSPSMRNRCNADLRTNTPAESGVVQKRSQW